MLWFSNARFPPGPLLSFFLGTQSSLMPARTSGRIGDADSLRLGQIGLRAREEVNPAWAMAPAQRTVELR